MKLLRFCISYFKVYSVLKSNFIWIGFCYKKTIQSWCMKDENQKTSGKTWPGNEVQHIYYTQHITMYCIIYLLCFQAYFPLFCSRRDGAIFTRTRAGRTWKLPTYTGAGQRHGQVADRCASRQSGPRESHLAPGRHAHLQVRPHGQAEQPIGCDAGQSGAETGDQCPVQRERRGAGRGWPLNVGGGGAWPHGAPVHRLILQTGLYEWRGILFVRAGGCGGVEAVAGDVGDVAEWLDPAAAPFSRLCSSSRIKRSYWLLLFVRE